MAFIEENGTVVSFADATDVEDRDRRLFEINEGLSDEYIEEVLKRSTERLLLKFRSTNWWMTNYQKRHRDQQFDSPADFPGLDIDRIIRRKQDFTDLCVYHALSEYIYPSVADFSDEENAEKNKMEFYQTKWNELFNELVTAGDWYDWDDDGTVTKAEKDSGKVNLKRVR